MSAAQIAAAVLFLASVGLGAWGVWNYRKDREGS